MYQNIVMRAVPLFFTAVILGACGNSDSDDTIVVDGTKDKTSVTRSSVTRVNENLELVGSPTNYNTELNGKLGIKIDDAEPFILDLSKVELPSTRPDIFASGQHSAFDVLRYLSSIGKLNLTWDGKINNQDTVDYKVNGEDDWYYKFNNNSYKLETNSSKQMGLFHKLEYSYDRIDQFLIKNGTIIQFLRTPDVMKEIKDVRQSEMKRTSFASEGKVIVPNVYIHMKMRATPHLSPNLEHPDYHLKNVVVDSYNLRPDLYAPGTVTFADMFATIASNPEYNSVFPADARKVQMVFWPKLKIGTDRDDMSEVESYAVSQIAGKHEDTLAAWALFAGESNHRTDFSGRGDFSGGKCLDPVHYPEGISTEFCNFFGGHLVHVMPDNRILRNAPEEIHLFWYDLWMTLDYDLPSNWDAEGNRLKKKWSSKEDHYQYYTDPTNPKPEGFSVPDIDDAQHPLNDTHFGYGVADCGQCHSVENIHVKGDLGEKFDLIRPHECAECHGANGAPAGHDVTGRCYWCHQDVKGHRDMNENGDSVDAISDIFPDPYSCATCHKNKFDGVTDRAVTKDMEMVP